MHKPKANAKSAKSFLPDLKFWKMTVALDSKNVPKLVHQNWSSHHFDNDSIGKTLTFISARHNQSLIEFSYSQRHLGSQDAN